ncbi:hypothetical protein BTO30_08725 [Domibacillus antri]|uniref:EAL domain-containing protein n=2 Tax=Domibacillus antri TaxID=1714264 RepID=A0A1Q8Q5N8_9BACI|nr:hypothetical protein BTO30_08725 [Domibacillus antri]
MIDLQQVIPYFQPIVSADEQEIWGYEVLGRLNSPSGVKSLGPFFNDPEEDAELQRRVDQHIRQSALQRFAKVENKNTHLFININPDWLQMDWQDGDKDWISKHGVDPKQVVLEVTEFLFLIKEKELIEMLDYYRKLGCKIAIDDVGKGFSNLDRIASFHPDILKVDILLLKNSTHSKSFMDVLQSLSVLARKMGASLLFEGIETQSELQNAWKSGGRFYQGYLFGRPNSSFQELYASAKKEIVHMIDQLIEAELTAWKNQFELEHSLNQTLKRIQSSISTMSDPMVYLSDLAAYMKDFCYRVYVCDDKGYQKTDNFILSKGKWRQQPEYKGKNWSWRPYFVYNIARMKMERRGMLSEPYPDLETNLLIRTFSYPIDRGYLFMDIMIDSKKE